MVPPHYTLLCRCDYKAAKKVVKMAWIKITSEGVRNLKPMTLIPGEKTTFFTGKNGAGKTSVLEAIGLLSTGRSFRNNNKTSFINEDQDSCFSFGLWKGETNEVRFGVKRSKTKPVEIHKDGEKQRSFEQTYKTFGLKVLTPDVFTSLSGNAEQRRNLIDWSLFHVEQSFRKDRSIYNQTLKQRNALLKRYPTAIQTVEKELMYWSELLVSKGNNLDADRKKSAQKLQTGLERLNDWPSDKLKDKHILVKYARGWPQDKNLKELLFENQKKDIKKRSTQYGPHRFDINLFSGKERVTDVLSRGELKTLAIACQLLQMQTLIEQGIAVVVLIDDLFAELDLEHATWCLEQIHKMEKVQTFITGVTIPEEIYARYSGKGMRWFHVEHGKIYNKRESNLLG